jgi:hypothetical protein
VRALTRLLVLSVEGQCSERMSLTAKVVSRGW